MTITQALYIRLARLRTRYARTPLPRFFAWWGRELASLLPARWRAALAERSDALLLGTQERELVLWRHGVDASSELGRVPLDEPAEAQQAVAACAAAGDPELRRYYCIEARTCAPSICRPPRRQSAPGAGVRNGPADAVQGRPGLFRLLSARAKPPIAICRSNWGRAARAARCRTRSLAASGARSTADCGAMRRVARAPANLRRRAPAQRRACAA